MFVYVRVGVGGGAEALLRRQPDHDLTLLLYVIPLPPSDDAMTTADFDGKALLWRRGFAST
jgi:hypothetical protein